MVFCQNVTFAVELEKNTFKNIYVLFGSTRLSQKLKSMLFEIFSLLQLSIYLFQPFEDVFLVKSDFTNILHIFLFHLSRNLQLHLLTLSKSEGMGVL